MTKELERIRDFVFNNEKEVPKLKKVLTKRFWKVDDEIYSDQEDVYEEDYSGDCEDNFKHIFKPSSLLED